MKWQKLKNKQGWRVPEFPFFNIHLKEGCGFYTDRGSDNSENEKFNVAKLKLLSHIKAKLLQDDYSLKLRLDTLGNIGYGRYKYCKNNFTWITSLDGWITWSSISNSFSIRLENVSEEDAKKHAEKIYQRHKKRFLKYCEDLNI